MSRYHGDSLEKEMWANFNTSISTMDIGIGGHDARMPVASNWEYWVMVLVLIFVGDVILIVGKVMWDKHTARVAHQAAVDAHSLRLRGAQWLRQQARLMEARYQDGPMPRYPDLGGMQLGALSAPVVDLEGEPGIGSYQLQAMANGWALQ
jgi:hypothetical protein